MLDRVARRWTSLTFDVRFLRARCPTLDVGGEAIGEFLRSGPLRFALATGSGGQRAHQVRYVQPRAVTDEFGSSAALRKDFFLLLGHACDRLCPGARGVDHDVYVYDPRFQRRTPGADAATETASSSVKGSQPEQGGLGGAYNQPARR